MKTPYWLTQEGLWVGNRLRKEETKRRTNKDIAPRTRKERLQWLLVPH